MKTRKFCAEKNGEMCVLEYYEETLTDEMIENERDNFDHFIEVLPEIESEAVTGIKKIGKRYEVEYNKEKNRKICESRKIEILVKFIDDKAKEKGFKDFAQLNLFANSGSNEIFTDNAVLIVDKVTELKIKLKVWCDEHPNAPPLDFETEINSIWDLI